MALFFREPSFDMSRRLTGFNRYRQLLSFYTLRWMKMNLLTIAGCLPLAAGIVFALLTSSVAMMIPLSSYRPQQSERAAPSEQADCFSPG